MDKKVSFISILCLIGVLFGQEFTTVDQEKVLSFILNSDIAFVIIPAIFLLVTLKIILPNVNELLAEGIRRNILEPYSLNERQVCYRICIGEPVYAENSDEGIFVKLISKGDLGLVEYLYSKEIIEFNKEIFLSNISNLVERGKLKAYDFKAYTKLLEKGYGLYNKE